VPWYRKYVRPRKQQCPPSERSARPYFDRRGRLLALALAAAINADDCQIAPLEDMIWTICDEYSWCLPAHLGAAAGPGHVGRQAR
jgi:hypothetical protein